MWKMAQVSRMPLFLVLDDFISDYFVGWSLFKTFFCQTRNKIFIEGDYSNFMLCSIEFLFLFSVVFCFVLLFRIPYHNEFFLLLKKKIMPFSSSSATNLIQLSGFVDFVAFFLKMIHIQNGRNELSVRSSLLLIVLKTP